MIELREYQKRMIGKRFGNLIVIKKSHSDNGFYWLCLCDCGNETIGSTSHLNSGIKKSCGCSLKKNRMAFKNEMFKHGKTNDPLFTVWQGMVRRCNDPNRDDYKNYGGRGIGICHEWLVSFKAFLTDMGKRPKGATLERIDTNKDYCKNNCKWATRTEQNRNSRNSKWWFINGFVFSSASLAGEYFGVSHGTIINWCENKNNCYSKLKYDD